MNNSLKKIVLITLSLLMCHTIIFGQTPSLEKEWEKFGDNVKELGPWLFNQPGVPSNDSQIESDGYRYLATLLYVGLDIHLLNADPNRPQWTPTFTNYARYGGDQRDGIYHSAPVDSKGTYLIKGKAQGGLPVAATIQTMSGWWTPGMPNETVKTQNVFDFDLESDGSFELILGGEKVKGNYMPLPDGITHLMARQYVANDMHQSAYQLSIERIDIPLTVPQEFDTPETLSNKLNNVIGFVKNLSTSYLDLTKHSLTLENDLQPLPDEAKAALGASQENSYYVGSWNLNNDEALFIEVTPTEAEYWSVAVHNFFYQGLPHSVIPEELNNTEFYTDSDGKIRVIISVEDPGYYNWISTGGLDIGVIVSRWNMRKGKEIMQTKKVDFKDLVKLMPKDSKKLSKKEREIQLKRKRDQILRRHHR